VAALTFDGGGWWAYVLVFLAAATPVLEVLVVVPAGVLAGMSPVPTALVAVAGNLATVVLVAVAGDRLLAWWRRRRPQADTTPSARSRRGGELVRRWGVPGLAFLAPLTTGTHIGTIAALATGAERRRVLVWMSAGVFAWAAITAAATASGLDAFT
jgi:Ca2+/H+ antiporter, TMEM165/GDT1 family